MWSHVVLDVRDSQHMDVVGDSLHTSTVFFNMNSEKIIDFQLERCLPL
jgi:hypothetical protein